MSANMSLPFYFKFGASDVLSGLESTHGTKVYVNTKNKLLSAQFRHTASSSQTEEEGRGGREPVGEM